MNTQSQPHSDKSGDERSSHGETVVGDAQTVIGFAVLGCLVAGGVGLVKAMSMERGSDVLLCLLGSVAAFGAVFYVYFRKT